MITSHRGNTALAIRIRLQGRASRPLTRAELHELFEALWTAEAVGLPRYPTVIGGVSASYQDASGQVIEVDSLESLLERYDEQVTVIVTISGGLENRPDVTLEYRYAGAEAKLEVRADDQAAATQPVDEFRRRFPLRPFTALDIHLRQRAYSFKSPDVKQIPNVLSYYSRHNRLQEKQRLGVEYPHFFERFVAEVLRADFSMSVGINYRIQREGEGGDFDVLALNDARELFYFECKSGSSVKKRDFQHFFRRYQFLRPAAAVMVFDETKANMARLLIRMRQVLLDEERRINPSVSTDPNFEYPDFTPIPSADRVYAFHIRRNLFFCSGENIGRAIAHCLRYYDGIVKQSSYLS